MPNEPFYSHHVFFCTNMRDQNRACCGAAGSEDIRNYAKKRLNAESCKSDVNVRVNTAGCMGRCDEGPVIAVYPEGIWYTYLDQSDVDEIIDEHILNNRPVERLKI
jgi:(2Fe-2S) ferredoxin